MLRVWARVGGRNCVLDGGTDSLLFEHRGLMTCILLLTSQANQSSSGLYWVWFLHHIPVLFVLYVMHRLVNLPPTMLKRFSLELDNRIRQSSILKVIIFTNMFNLVTQLVLMWRLLGTTSFCHFCYSATVPPECHLLIAMKTIPPYP